MLIVVRVILIFLLVAVMAGGIAMLGNQLGRKIGRRKMTIFGLRPRHTSIFITTVTGSIIACLTLALAMLFSNDVRIVIQGKLEEVQKLEARATELQRQIAILYDEARRGTIIWNYEQEIALNTIPAGEDTRAVATIIDSSLKYANYISVIKNNKVAAQQNAELLEPEKFLLLYTPEEFDTWVQQYTDLPEPVGLWVVVTENCLFGDAVPVTVRTFPVKLLYSEGSVVYSREVKVSEFLLDWHVFIEDLKKEALRNGMIEFDNSLGAEIDGDMLAKISRVVEHTEGTITLEAVANRDLYKSSKLDVSIRVKQ